MVYSWKRDLLSLPKEQILLKLLASLGDESVCIEDAKAAIAESLRNDGMVSFVCGKAIYVNFSSDNLDFTDFARRYGAAALEDAIMQMQIAAIEDNCYLSVLQEACFGFGMFGRFLSYASTLDPIYKGIYFVCGYDREKVTDPNLDISQIIKTQYGASRLRLDIHAEKVTGSSPYAVHQKTVHYCLNASTIRMLCQKFNIARIDACSGWFVKNISMLCRNAFSNKWDMIGRSENKVALGNFFPIQSRVEIAFEGYGDPLDYLIHTAPERIPLFKKDGMVKMETLVEHIFEVSGVKFINPAKGDPLTNFLPFSKLLYRALHVSALTLPVDESKKLQQILIDSYPHILFSLAQCNEGTTVFYESIYRTDFQQAVLIARKPYLFERNYQLAQLEQENASYYCIGVHLNDLDLLVSRADNMGLRLCVNGKSHMYAYNASAQDMQAGNYIYAVCYPMEQDALMETLLADTKIKAHYQPAMNKEKTRGLFVAYTSLKSVGEVKRWLAANPQIKYYQAKAVAASLSGTAAKTGFGSPEANRFSSIFFVMDARYAEQIEYIFMKARNPKYFQYTLADIQKLGEQHVREGKARGAGTSSVGVPSGDLARIFENAERYELPVCINQERIFYTVIDAKSGLKDNAYTLTFPSADTASWDSLLWQISEIDRKDRLVKMEDLKIY